MKKVNVRMLAAATSANGKMKKGQIYALRPEDAKPLIQAGAAEKVSEAEAAAEKE